MSWKNRLIKVLENLTYSDVVKNYQTRDLGSTNLMLKRKGRGGRILLTRPRKGAGPRR